MKRIKVFVQFLLSYCKMNFSIVPILVSIELATLSEAISFLFLPHFCYTYAIYCIICSLVRMFVYAS